MRNPAFHELATTDKNNSTSDSFIFVQPIVDHAPTKVAAKQWLQGYQLGPVWVPPIVAPGTAANVFLAFTANTPYQRNVYIAAALCIFSIMPITFFYMEPGINGALKWKIQSLLKDEGMNWGETSVFVPSVTKHGATQASRRWAEKTDLKELIRFWRRINDFRYFMGGVAALLSGYATFSQLA